MKIKNKNDSSVTQWEGVVVIILKIFSISTQREFFEVKKNSIYIMKIAPFIFAASPCVCVD